MSTDTKQKSIFDEFTGKYSLSKTLRFELKPVGNTSQMLEDEDVFEKDRIIREKYRKTKPYFDRLHREFIKQSLENQKIPDLKEYFQCLTEVQKNKKNKDAQEAFKKISQSLRKKVNDLFKTDALFGEGVFALLKEKYGKGDKAFLVDEDGQYILDETKNKISIFDSWKGFIGYFTKFQETRKNFYKDDGTATAVATRIIDQNLKRFCENIQVFKSTKNKVDFKEVGDNFSVDLNNIFSLEFYNSCLLKDGINAYNEILGGKLEKTGEKLKGLNELINKYRQDHKGEKLAFFKILDKQILSEKEKFIEGIDNDEELLKTLKEFYSSAEEKTQVLRELFSDFIKNNENYDLSEIYISREALNTISHRWVNATVVPEFERSLYEVMKKNKQSGLGFDKSDSTYKFPDFITLSYIKGSLEKLSGETVWKDGYFKDEERINDKGFLIGNEPKWDQFIKIFRFEFNSLFDTKSGERSVGYDHFKNFFEKLINRDQNNFSINQEDKIVIREFVDNVLTIYQMAKYFAIEKKRKWLDDAYDTGTFYHHPDFGYKTKFYDDAYEKIVKVRMLLQSYLTKKPFSTDKWKLNFENPTLADGWDKNKETDNTAVILRRDGRYYLGVMNKYHNSIFVDQPKSDSGYEKMIYAQMADPSKDIHNLILIDGKTVCKKGRKDKDGVNRQLESIKSKYLPKEINDIRTGKAYLRSSENFNKNKANVLINYYKDRLVDYYQGRFIFNFRGDYNDFKDFSDHVAEQTYWIRFEKVSENYISEVNNKGQLYLFEIYNKDWGIGPKDKNRARTKNTHTLYFESLFSEENKDLSFPFKLNGEAELFYRPKTAEDKLGTKTDKRGRKVINHKRYSRDKVFFHVPITLNRVAGENYNYNQKINEFLINNPDINIIGVDRGEKHLIYYAGIDQRGNILKDKMGKDVLGSLNEINGINYHTLLEERASAREKARQDWQNIQGIKDLKRGYISLVVRKLADLIIEHNAILVLEDLNMRFKQIRGGIEKSVYQQLEKALIEKLIFWSTRERKIQKRLDTYSVHIS